MSHLLTLAAAAVAAALIANPQSRELREPHYTIHYEPGFERDAEFARTWLDRTEQLMRSKYGVVADGYRMTIVLLGAPADGIDVNTSGRNRCCTASSGLKTGVISWLAPSAPIWTQQALKSSLGLQKSGDDYHAKVLVSEYIPIGYYAVQDARGAGWSFYSAPQWFVQGLEEYDAIFHSTVANRTETAGKLFDWARNNRAVFRCCSPSLEIGDPYNGGAAFMAFLAAEYGDTVHATLLRSPAATFDDALREAIAPRALPELFERFTQWLATAAP